jgi:Tfp pilus assembly protein PilF
MCTVSRCCSIFILLLFLEAGTLMAQRQRGPTSPQPAEGNGAGVGTVSPGPNPATPAGRTTQPATLPGQPDFGQQRQPYEQRPIFLSGKVMLDDGMPPPESVIIERVCNGQPRPAAYTDSKGHFTFQFGQESTLLMDASVANASGQEFGRSPMTRNSGAGGFGSMGNMGGASSMGPMQLMGCELRASLPGYRSESVNLGRRSIFDNPDVGTIILHRIANVQATAISFTTLAAPKEARKSFEKAQKFLQQKNARPAEAIKELEKAVEVYPQYAAAWNLLGETRLSQKDEEGARKAFERSLAADPKYVNPYLHLAAMDLRASQWAAAADITSRLTQMNPFLGQAHYFNAIANYNLGKMDLAEKSARSAMQSDSGNGLPMLHQLLGTILARQGNFPSAAEEFRSFLKLAPNSPNAEQLRKQLTDWEGLGVIQRAETAVKK